MGGQKRESSQESQDWSEEAGSNNEVRISCCGPEMAGTDQMIRSCPCGAIFRDSKGSLVVALAVAGLVFSVVVTGWVLGMLAFLRTI